MGCVPEAVPRRAHAPRCTSRFAHRIFFLSCFFLLAKTKLCGAKAEGASWERQAVWHHGGEGDRVPLLLLTSSVASRESLDHPVQ